MESFEKEVITRLTKIETKLDNFDYKKIEATATEALTISRNNEKDICTMKDNNKWLWRTIVGSVILWLLNFVYGFFK